MWVIVGKLQLNRWLGLTFLVISLSAGAVGQTGSQKFSLTRRSLCRTALSGAIAGLSPIAAYAESEFNWGFDNPENQGLSTSALNDLRSFLEGRETTHFVVIRNDRIVYQFPRDSFNQVASTASAAKGLVGGLSLAVAVSRELIGFEDFVHTYIPAWRNIAGRNQIQIKHLGSHTSGLRDADAEGREAREQTFWNGNGGADSFRAALGVPMLVGVVPGTRFQYSNPGIANLAYAVTASLKNFAQIDIRSLLEEQVLTQIGVPTTEFRIGYENEPAVVDGLPLVATWGGASISPNAAARIARLLMRGGVWEDSEILNPEAVRQIIADSGLPGEQGMGWWTNAGGLFDPLPRDTFFAWGKGSRIVVAMPSQNLIVVRWGNKTLGERGNPIPPADLSNFFSRLMSSFQ